MTYPSSYWRHYRWPLYHRRPCSPTVRNPDGSHLSDVHERLLRRGLHHLPMAIAGGGGQQQFGLGGGQGLQEIPVNPPRASRRVETVPVPDVSATIAFGQLFTRTYLLVRQEAARTNCPA